MKLIIVTAAAIAALAAAGCASTGTKAASPVTSGTPSAASTTPSAAPAAATPDPKGTYSGSCDYTLSDSFDLSNPIIGTLIGEIDLKNTGNVGNIVRVKITWPQEGFAPVAAHRTVHVAFGKSRTVRFHIPATQNVIDEIQSWQDKHGLADGCHYHAAITGTYGAAH